MAGRADPAAAHRGHPALLSAGGTSSNDGGAGLLAALGVKFTGTFRREIAPSPNGLAKLISVDVTGLDARLADCEITLLSDVNNPLTGERGATAIFGPQRAWRCTTWRSSTP